MRTKTALISGIFLAVFLASGCTVAGRPDGGIYKSTDGGKVFSQKVRINEKSNIGNASILSLEFDPNNSETIYIGTRANGILRSTDGGENWTPDINKFQSVSSIVVDPNSSSNIYITAVRDGRGKILKTTNGGEQWDEIFTERINGPQVLSLAVDEIDTNVIYAGDSLGGIYKSEDGGTTWKTLLWAQSAVSQIVMDTVNPSVIYFGTVNSGALVSKDKGQNFTEIITEGAINHILAHPYQENVVYLSNGDGLQRSNDNGQTWQKINTILKPQEKGPKSFAVSPENDNEIMFASGGAFYKTSNGGETWATVQFNISKEIVLVKIDPKNTGTVYLGSAAAEGGTLSLFPF